MNVVVIYDPVILVVVSNINFLSINYGGRKKKGGKSFYVSFLNLPLLLIFLSNIYGTIPDSFELIP
jgi:hypothetical protein